MIVNFYRYDNGSNRGRKHANDKRLVSTAKKIHRSQKSNKRTQGKYNIVKLFS